MAMATTPKELLEQLMQAEGAMCAALVDYHSGMLLESATPRSCAPRCGR
jgi:hypothetical protein